MSSIQALLSGVLAVLTAAAIAPRAAPLAPPLPIETLGGRCIAAVEKDRPEVLMFWRADCGPCRLELDHLQRLRAAAAPLRLRLVGLQPADVLVRALPPGPDVRAIAFHALGPPEQVLTAWGGAPPRLPLAVAVDGKGRVCARHSGLIGTERLQAWARTCGGADAGG